MATVMEGILTDTQEHLEEIVETLEGLTEWAEENGFPAIQHKLEEATGRLQSAATAAGQYADGTLEQRS